MFTSLSSDTSTNNLVFVDSNVEGLEKLLQNNSIDTEVIMLDANTNGIEQISETLVTHLDLDSIHIVSHGQQGQINLGNTELSLDTWDANKDLLQDWSEALTPDADLILYGCNITGNNDGLDLVNALADMTTADVAASDDLTGNAAFGGDWDWETTTGTIESELPLMTEAIEDYQYLLSASDMSGMNHMSEHSALTDLVPHDKATHVAVKNGHWFDPQVWKNGRVPGNNADVLIPKGRTLWYGKQSNARLDTLRVDGRLNFAPQRNSKMLVDTFVVSSQGSITIGRKDQPVRSDKTAQIIFTSDTAIDTQWDKTQLSRGLISEGKVEIYGADKLDFVSLKGNALKGDRELVLDLPAGQNSPLGWQVGDRLVLGGTRYRHTASDEDNARFQDEELTITAINGNRIRFTNDDIATGDNRVLRFDHQLPKGFENKLDLYVANTTRNVSFATENGEDAPTKQRGHVMFMHNRDVVVQNAGFYDLGRTDKNQLIDDPGQNIDGSTGSGKNPRGRYAFHLHKTGLNPNQTPALAKGNAVVGSPGWGLVHHASNAVLEDNVVFDVVGAGIVAEAGNEIGAWRNNLTMKMTGDDRRNAIDLNGPREFLFDFGFNGEGYWVQGAALIEMEDNIAISSHAGIAFFGEDKGSEEFREVEQISVDYLPTSWRNIAKGTADETKIDVSAVPVRKLSGFESYNSGDGILSWGRMHNKDGQLAFNFGTDEDIRPAHDFRWSVDDFKLWNIVGSGVSLKYSSNVDLNNGLILGKPQRSTSSGVGFNDSSNKIHFNNLQIEGFVNGITVPYDADKDFVGSKIENSYFANNRQAFGSPKAQLVIKPGEEDFPAFFQIADNNIFDGDRNNLLPRAKFVRQTIGGLGISLDASTSFDGDSTSLKKDSKGIVSYGWDFDGDSKIDKYGRQVSHHFERAGNHDVTLTVWDSQGASHSLTKTFNIQRTNYRNAFVDGNFTNINKFAPARESNSIYSNAGWFATPGTRYNTNLGNGGAAILTSGKARSVIGQVIQDNGIRKGSQTLKIDLKNTEGLSATKFLNDITISLWGINGEFNNLPYSGLGPTQAGVLPMQSDKLLEQSLGGKNFNWKTFGWDVNLGAGYQFLLVQIQADKVNHQGDYVAVDNVRLN